MEPDITDLEVRISENSQKLRELDSLFRALGFRHSEFRTLRDIITEIGEERGMIGKEAVKDFFEDLQEHYYDYLRLRKSLAELKAEKAKLSARDATNLINMIESFIEAETSLIRST